jgi:hypothetical protein
MTYPPQPGGWPDQQGAWPGQAGAWPESAGGTWSDPATGQPYLDPASGQPYQQPGGYAVPGGGYATAPGYGGYAQYGAYPPVMVANRRTNGLSIASMVIAIVALVSSPCYGIPGVAIGLVGAILGHVGHRQTKERDEDGGGMAVAGIVIGWLAVLAGVIALGFYIWVWYWVKNTVENYPTTYPT